MWEGGVGEVYTTKDKGERGKEGEGEVGERKKGEGQQKRGEGIMVLIT